MLERCLLDGLLGGVTSHVLIAVLVFMFAATDPWYTPLLFNSHHIIMGMSQFFLLRQAFEVKRVHELS